MSGPADALVATPLSLDQLRLLRAMLDCPAQSFRSYGIAKVAGDLSFARLHDASERLSREHELLRSRLVSIPGMTGPVLMPAKAGSTVYHDMGRLDGDEDGAVDRLEQELGSARFSFEESPLVHVCVGRLDDDAVLWGLATPAFLADGPSVDMLLKKISRAALDTDAGTAARIQEPTPLPYTSICRWRERLLASEEAAVGKRLWLERLTSDDHATRDTILPAARAARAGSAPGIRRVVTRLPAHVVAQLAGSGRSGAASSRFFAAWYFLLWKLCDCPAADFQVAAHFDGRCLTDFANAIGPLERFLPIAAPVDRAQRWRKLCDDLSTQLERATEWQDCFSWSDFDDLEGSSAPMRSFDYCFEWLPAFVESGTALALRRRYSRSERYRLKLDVLCSHESGCELALYHDPQHVSHAHANALLGAYRYVLEQAAADDTVRLADLQWPEAARSRSQATTSRVPAPAAAVQDITERFTRIAAQYPDRIALAGDDRSLSYARLHQRAEALALTIRDRAPAPESCVAMIGGISFNTIIGLVAILKAGHYFVYIDPEHPPARTAKALRECGARVILHDGALADAGAEAWLESLRPDGAEVIGVEAASLPCRAPVGKNNAAAAHADRLAYVTYTSGSTGESNGVMISQASLTHQIAWLVESFGFSHDDSWLLKTPLGFDASIWEWVTPLCVGGGLVFGGKNLHRDPTRIVESVRDHRVTVLQVVPGLLRFLVDEARPDDLCSLRHVFAGGEALPRDVCHAVSRRCRATLINLYGPTETTINATSWEVPRQLPPSADVAIGRPVAGMSACVLDTLDQPLPPNFIGELYLTGSGLARGYAQKPRLTAEKFVPTWCGAGQRMYRTGDLVSCAEDGTLFYWGRCDSQIKLRGYRIELGEIEAVLSSHGTVKTTAACICTATDSADSAHLIAYVVPKDPASRFDTQKLREYLRERLPEYMVPAAIVDLDALPLTLSGKIDRKTLASRDFVGRPRFGPYVAPETSTQATLCEIWRRLLGVERVGIDDDFLKLGGRSVLVTRLIGHVRDALGIDISPRVLFDFPVLRDFAEQIDQLHSSKIDRDAISLP